MPTDVSSTPPLRLPPRPPRRPASRISTLYFWTVLVLFVAGLCYLGLLAFTTDAGPLILDSGIHGHLLSGLLLAGAIVAAVAAGIATHHRHDHHHHHLR